MSRKSDNIEKAIFAAGCFWGVEDRFRRHEGVVNTRVGYIGGHIENPDYQQVCQGHTGHAEAVEVTYDSKKTSFESLADLFFSLHDPTQKNRQGPDIGDQYRSEIFALNDDQIQTARKILEDLRQSRSWPDAIVTRITDASDMTFWEAEEYHQEYLLKQRGQK